MWRNDFHKVKTSTNSKATGFVAENIVLNNIKLIPSIRVKGQRVENAEHTRFYQDKANKTSYPTLFSVSPQKNAGLYNLKLDKFPKFVTLELNKGNFVLYRANSASKSGDLEYVFDKIVNKDNKVNIAVKVKKDEAVKNKETAKDLAEELESRRDEIKKNFPGKNLPDNLNILSIEELTSLKKALENKRKCEK